MNYVLTFNAGPEDTAGYSTAVDCMSKYCNVRLSDILSSGNLIQRISSGDITQFIVTLGYQFNIDLDGNLIGRTPTFNEVKALNGLAGTYLSGPHISCPDQLAWVLYSVADKRPITLLNDILPPYANDNKQCIIKLDMVLIGSGDDAYYDLSFPTGYQLRFQSTPGDVVFATRIIGIQFSWEYVTPDQRTGIIYETAVYMDNTPIIVRALP